MSLVRAVRRYPVIFVTAAVLAAVLILLTTDSASAARWVASLYVGAFTAWTIVRMIQRALHGTIGLDVLAVVAMGATLAVGEYIASLIIVLMLSGGEALEDFAARRARHDLSLLLDRSPRTAHVIAAGDATHPEAIRDVAVDDVAVGDILLVRPSEVVPVDAVLQDDEADFDESSLTGESMPVAHGRGDEVLSGSVNGTRAVRIRAIRRSTDSQYQQIVALVRESEASRAPVVRLADRFAIPFTAISLAIAAAAWIIAGDPVRFAEVLVLATPCPLLIAAPVAFIAGQSRAARLGVIVKGGAAIERLARVRSAAFDKTGTLTRGRPVLVAVRPEPGFDEEELLTLAASAEVFSSHVLADGVRRAAMERGLQLRAGVDASESATNGVAAVIEGRRVVVGKPAFVAEHVGDFPRGPLDAGQAAAYVGVDGRFAGTLVLADDPRPEARAVVAWMRAHGILRVAMLTGDGRSTAESIGRAVGIDEVHAELLPREKVELAAGQQPRPVMMVGDGVNDAPVLAASDVGVAMGAKGATAAGEAADVVLLIDSLTKVADALWIGRRTLRIALTAIWIGMALSVGLMLVAATGVIPAVVGALVQELVDVATIVYALRALGGRALDLSTGAEAVRVQA